MSKPDIDPEALHGSWVRSPEEDTATEMVFRPPSYPFPPSRSRDGMRLSPDGTLTQATAGATDLARQRAGRWRVENGALHLQVGDEAGRVLHLLALSSDRLVAKR